jgi:hypothetical protein
MKSNVAGKKLETTKLYLLASTSLNMLFGIAILYLASEISYQSMHKKIIMQPAFPIDKPIELGWNNGEIEKRNLQKVGELISLWTLNYTPQTIQQRFYKILNFVEPNSYNEIKEVLDAEIYKIKENKITQSFHPASSVITKEAIVIKGIAIRSLAGKQLDTEQIRISIFYAYSPELGFLIKSIKREKDKK